MAEKYMTTAKPQSSPTLHIARVPGELGPVVRCSGDLTLATAEALRRELNLLASPRRPVLILNVAGCHTVDGDGLSLLLDLHRKLRDTGFRFVVVAGMEGASRCIHTLGGDPLLPLFTTEQDAALALRTHATPSAETAPPAITLAGPPV
jgi:anti-anti-sigma factor